MDKNDLIYNESIKNDFLSTYPENTQVTYKRIFVNSYEIEEHFGKDLYDFNVKEVTDVLYKLAPKTPAASRTNGRIIAAYWDWAIEKGLRKTGKNPFKKTSPSWFDDFARDVKLYLSDSEIKKVEDSCVNAQDAVVIRALYEGVMGMECAELYNIKKQDIDYDHNELKLTDYDGSIRYLEVSNECMRIIQQAIKQREYQKKNGEMEDPEGRLREFTDLVNNDFLLRNSITRTDNYNDHVDKHTIYRRIDVIRESTGFPYLTAKNIARSGMIKMAKDLVEKHGELNKDVYEAIAKRYRVNNIANMYDFINMDMIKELYGE